MQFVRYAVSTAAGLAALVGATGPLAAEPLEVGIAAEPYPPFTYKGSDGDWTGFEVELSQLLCERIDAECEIAPTGWDGIIPALRDERIDMIMTSMSITEKRQEVIDFTDPYYYTHGAYVAEKDLEFDVEGETAPEDLDGLILGVQSATTHAAFAREELRDVAGRIRTYDDQEDANRDLLAGRVDVVLADELPMGEFVDRDEASGYEIKGVAPKHSAFGEGIGIGLRKDSDDLRERLNDAIAEVIDDGSCAEISDKYFGRDICGG